MKETIIIAGFGGQGVLSMGKILAYSGIMQDLEVTWMPSYGPEMRGGTANVTVIISDKKISSPIAGVYDTAIVLNQQSLDKFESKVRPGGVLIYDTNGIVQAPTRTDIEVYTIDAAAECARLGQAKLFNTMILGGYLKVKLYSNVATVVKSITISGNNGEKIAGAATVTMAYGETPQLSMATGSVGSITLDCGSGVMLSSDAEKPTEFWFVVPAVEFSEGLTIVATDTNGVTFEKSTNKKVTITRNEIQPMAAVETIFSNPTKPAYNEIWYTSSDGYIVKPYSGQYNDYADALTTFGANIVSNTYKDGKGVITFDGNVTTIGARAFYDCDSLTSVTIPDSVTTIGERAFYYCKKLTSVYCKATTPPSLGDYAFKYYDYSNYSYINIGCTIYVPRGCGSAYKSALDWSDYADDIVEYDFESGESGGNDDGGEPTTEQETT